MAIFSMENEISKEVVFENIVDEFTAIKARKVNI